MTDPTPTDPAPGGIEGFISKTSASLVTAESTTYSLKVIILACVIASALGALAAYVWL
jgi:hypothetical protein